MKLKTVVFYGSVRTERLGIRAARFVVKQLEKRGHEVTLLDPKDLALPLLDRMFKEYKPGEAPPALQRAADAVIPADGYLIVSGEYNHSVPPALSNLIDHFLEEYLFKPSAVVSYSAGAFGGVRAAMQLRALLAEVGMSSIPSTLPIPKVQDAFSDDGTPSDPKMEKRSEKFFREFEWYATALKEARARGIPSA